MAWSSLPSAGPRRRSKEVLPHREAKAQTSESERGFCMGRLCVAWPLTIKRANSPQLWARSFEELLWHFLPGSVTSNMRQRLQCSCMNHGSKPHAVMGIQL